MRRGLAVLALLALTGCAYVTKAEFDDYWDKDEDGWPIGEDCDDLDPDVYPFAGDVRGDGCDADCHLTATPAWTVTRGDPNILVTVPIDVAVGPDGQIVVLGSGAGPPIPMGRAGWSRLTPAAPSGGSGMSRAESAMRSPLADRR